MFKSGYELAADELRALREEAIKNQREWDIYFMQMAKLVSTKSKDKSTKVGTVIVGKGREVLSTGYNGLPRGISYDDPSKHERPEKYIWFEHSERNAIFNSARVGIRLEGATAYLSCPPCPDCARALIQCGIVRVVMPVNHTGNQKPPADTWWDKVEKSKEMCKLAGVIFEVINDE
jgi:dCMP deaminase